MKRFFLICILWALCTLGVLHAQALAQLAPGAHIGQLVLDGNLDAGRLYGPMHIVYMTEAFKARDRALSELKENTMSALKEASGHEDLIKAIKQYYASASVFFHDVLTGSASRLDEQRASLLQSDMDKKAAAVTLEANLAGFDIPQI